MPRKMRVLCIQRTSVMWETRYRALCHDPHVCQKQPWKYKTGWCTNPAPKQAAFQGWKRLNWTAAKPSWAAGETCSVVFTPWWSVFPSLNSSEKKEKRNLEDREKNSFGGGGRIVATKHLKRFQSQSGSERSIYFSPTSFSYFLSWWQLHLLSVWNTEKTKQKNFTVSSVNNDTGLLDGGSAPSRKIW